MKVRQDGLGDYCGHMTSQGRVTYFMVFPCKDPIDQFLPVSPTAGSIMEEFNELLLV